MTLNPENLSEDLKKQRDLGRSAGKDYWTKPKLIRGYADHLDDQGERPTIAKIKEYLAWVDRGYSLNTDQISAALASRYRDGRVDKYSSNSQPVLIDGVRFKTIREAHRSLGVWPQTVLNHINSEDPKWADWKRA